MAGYEVPGAKRQHTTPPWTWNDKKKFWELDGSASDHGEKPDHRYTCVQYTMAKLEGKAPDLTKKEERDRLVENTEKLLTAAGYTKNDCAGCGCKDGGLKNCAVVFKSKSSAAVFHVAVFDPDFCDWGGKLSGSAPIARFEKPADYVATLSANEQPDTVYECWCKAGAGPAKPISDEDLSKSAKGERSGGGCFGFILVAIAAAIVLLIPLQAP